LRFFSVACASDYCSKKRVIVIALAIWVPCASGICSSSACQSPGESRTTFPSDSISSSVPAGSCIDGGSASAAGIGCYDGQVIAAKVREANQTVEQVVRAGSPILRQVLERRREMIATLIRVDPGRVRSVMLPASTRAVLERNQDLQALLEFEQEKTGTLEEAVADDFLHRTSSTQWMLHTRDSLVNLGFTSSANPSGLSRHIVTVSGVGTAHAMAVEAIHQVNANASNAGSAPATCSTTGAQNTAVILVDFPPGGPNLPPSLADHSYWSSQYFGANPSLNGYWNEVSYDQTSASGSIFGPYTLSQAYTCNQTSDLFTAAIQAASKDIDFSQFNRYAIMFPVSSCWFGGYASIGCGSADATIPQAHSEMWAAISTNADSSWDFTALLDHEHGHNLGLSHSNSLDFGAIPLGPLDYTASNPGTLQPAPPPPTAHTSNGSTEAVNTEYGDPFSVMGYIGPRGPYQAIERFHYLGWASPSDTRLVSQSGTFTIKPMESVSGTRALRVLRDPYSASFLWIEYRQPVGVYDSGLASDFPGTDLFRGALIHYENGYVDEDYDRHTFLLDFNPVATPNDFTSPALEVGKDWSDPYSLLSLKVIGADASRLNVAVTYDQPCAKLQISSNGIFPYEGGTGTLTITAPDSCSWQASTATAWITLTGQTSGSGNASVPFTVAPSSATAQQQGFITAQRQSVPVIQYGPRVTVESISPEIGSGRSQLFVMKARDPNGSSDIVSLDFYIGGCHVQVGGLSSKPQWPNFYLFGANGDGGVWPGTNTSAANEFCALYGSGSSIVLNGNEVTSTFNIGFANNAIGTHSLKASGWPSNSSPFGIFTVTSAAATAKPVFAPRGETFKSVETVTIQDVTQGAAIFYTTDGTDPSSSSTKYTAPITVSTTETIKAIAVAPGFANSGVVSSTYTLQAADPKINPSGGTYIAGTTVTMSDSSPGATIRYTTDGTAPTANSPVYKGPFTLNSATSIQARAEAPGSSPSRIIAVYFNIVPRRVKPILPRGPITGSPGSLH